jgi:acetyl-CoA C-acetyltransferase
VTDRPGEPEPEHPREPLGLMVAALQAALEDAGGRRERLARSIGSLRVVRSLTWNVPDPGALVAARLSLSPKESLHSTIGGNTPQAMVADAAAAIQRGDLDAAAVVGAETGYTRARARRSGERQALTEQDPTTPPARTFGIDRAPTTQTEAARGLTLPVNVYPLFENALRIEAGWTRTEHRQRIGALWSRFSQVAAANPFAWSPTALEPHEIVEPRPDNRMIAFPYPKLCTANIQVDQGAAVLMTSVELAEDAGIPSERWVFPWAAAEAHDHWFVSERARLSRSPAIAHAGRRALELAGIGIDEIALADLYSCFPCAVQLAARELGLDLDGDIGRLTQTGGLTFGGGPGNNYVSHGIASLTKALRERPGAIGMATGLGWYATKHAIGIYSTEPSTQGFRSENVQHSVDQLERWVENPEATGPAEVETFTVTYGRDGEPDMGIVACRTGPRTRTWANVTDPDQLAELVTAEQAGWSGRLVSGGRFELS